MTLLSRSQIIDFRVNGTPQDKHMTEWYFGASFVRKLVFKVKWNFRTSGVCQMTAFQPSTGYLTITIR